MSRHSCRQEPKFPDSLNTTITTLDTLMQRFGVGDNNKPPSPPATNAEPFRIQDYTQSAAEPEMTARQLTQLLIALDQTIGSTNLLQLSAQIGPAVQQAQTSGKEIVDYAFWKGIGPTVLVGDKSPALRNEKNLAGLPFFVDLMRLMNVFYALGLRKLLSAAREFLVL